MQYMKRSYNFTFLGLSVYVWRCTSLWELAIEHTVWHLGPFTVFRT